MQLSRLDRIQRIEFIVWKTKEPYEKFSVLSDEVINIIYKRLL